MATPARDCDFCGELGSGVTADLRAGESLPGVVGRMEAHECVECEYRSLRRCPRCGGWFGFDDHYWGNSYGGDSDHDQTVTLLPADVVHRLHAPACAAKCGRKA